MTKHAPEPVFSFETSDPKIVRISISKTGKDIIAQDIENIFTDLAENIDQSLRTAGYMYNIVADMKNHTMNITPFEDIESFNQEVFDIIAEELQFTDNLVRDTDLD